MADSTGLDSVADYRLLVLALANAVYSIVSIIISQIAVSLNDHQSDYRCWRFVGYAAVLSTIISDNEYYW